MVIEYSSSSIDPLHMTSLAQIAPSLSSKEDLSLAESCALRVRTFTFPLFDLSDGRQCKESIARHAWVLTCPRYAHTWLELKERVLQSAMLDGTIRSYRTCAYHYSMADLTHSYRNMMSVRGVCRGLHVSIVYPQQWWPMQGGL